MLGKNWNLKADDRFGCIGCIGGIGVAAVVLAGWIVHGPGGAVRNLTWLLLLFYLAAALFSVFHAPRIAFGAGRSPRLFEDVQVRRSSRPAWYWLLTIRTVVKAFHANATGPLALLQLPLHLLVARRLPRWIRWMPEIILSYVVPLNALAHLRSAILALALLGVMKTFPLATTPCQLWLGWLWLVVIVDLLSQLLPFIGLRAEIFLSRWPPLVIFLVLLSSQAFSVVATSRAFALSLNEDATFVEALSSPRELFHVRNVIQEPVAAMELLRQEPRRILLVLGVGLWYLGFTRLLLISARGKRTDEEVNAVVGALLVLRWPGPARKIASGATDPQTRLLLEASCMLALGHDSRAEEMAAQAPTSPRDPGRKDPLLYLLIRARYLSAFPAYGRLLRRWLAVGPPETHVLMVSLSEEYLSQDQRSALLHHADARALRAVLSFFSLQGKVTPRLLADRLCSVNPALHFYQLTADVLSLSVAMIQAHRAEAEDFPYDEVRARIASMATKRDVRQIRRRIFEHGDAVDLLVLGARYAQLAHAYADSPPYDKQTMRRFRVAAGMVGARLQKIAPAVFGAADPEAFARALVVKLSTKSRGFAQTRELAAAEMSADLFLLHPEHGFVKLTREIGQAFERWLPSAERGDERL